MLAAASAWAPVIQPQTPPRSLNLYQSPFRSLSQILRPCVGSPRALSQYPIPASAIPKGCYARFSVSAKNNDFASAGSSWLTKRKDFSSDEIRSIFGPQITVSEGNRILYQVQEQRLAGKIDEEIPGSQRYKERALAWLRKNVPFDEDTAILKRLEREELATLEPQGQQKGGEVYAQSVLEQERKENIAKRKKEEQEKERKAEAEGKKLPLSREQALVQRRQVSAKRVKKWHAHAQKDDFHSVPPMSFIQRVGPATLLTATVIYLCVMFAQNYSPPSQAARLFSDISPSAATIGVLVGLNGVVWLGWRSLPLRRSMQRVFILFPAYPRASSMIGSMFSHQSFRHLASNMLALWFVGTNLHEDIGRGPFLAVFLSCGIAASNVFLISTVLRKRWDFLTLGCSGALSGLLATWCCINSDKGIRIWPLPTRATEALQPMVVLALFIAVDVWGLWKGLGLGRLRLDSRIDHVSHLAGYGCGIVAAQFLQSPARQKQQRSKENLVAEPKMQRVENTTQS
ncbi:MAG: hypothetical protein Q9225_006610 [Loekoesia sp. 1 TL-2023]